MKRMIFVIIALAVLLTTMVYSQVIINQGNVPFKGIFSDTTYVLSENIYHEKNPVDFSNLRNVKLDGQNHFLQGPGYGGSGIVAYDCSDIIIENVNIDGYLIGMSLSCEDSQVNNCLLENNKQQGIILKLGCRNRISNNVIRDNGWDGIVINCSNDNVLVNNSGYGNGSIGEGHGIRITNSTNNTGESNHVRGFSGPSFGCQENGNSVENIVVQKEVNGYSIIKNYPNPFNPSTTIIYSLPKSENVKLTVYDIRGQEVATLVLVDETQLPGEHQVIFDGTGLTSGTYFSVLETESRRITNRMKFLK